MEVMEVVDHHLPDYHPLYLASNGNSSSCSLGRTMGRRMLTHWEMIVGFGVVVGEGAPRARHCPLKGTPNYEFGRIMADN
jgi:hypothetical protein